MTQGGARSSLTQGYFLAAPSGRVVTKVRKDLANKER